MESLLFESPIINAAVDKHLMVEPFGYDQVQLFISGESLGW